MRSVYLIASASLALAACSDAEAPAPEEVAETRQERLDRLVKENDEKMEQFTKAISDGTEKALDNTSVLGDTPPAERPGYTPPSTDGE